MNRTLMGLAVAAGLTIGMASTASAQVVVSLGNPYNGGGFYLNTGVPGITSYNSYYGPAAVAPYVGPGTLGYAPAPIYAGPRVYAPAYAPRVYGYGPVYRPYRVRRFWGW